MITGPVEFVEKELCSPRNGGSEWPRNRDCAFECWLPLLSRANRTVRGKAFQRLLFVLVAVPQRDRGHFVKSQFARSRTNY